ncbi:MAG: hypothetical protein M3Q27_10040 [Actinomycetota bacterium]|nr:hypothetical protein [Actinomycetota bacterium]
MLVELLYVDDCPNHRALAPRLRTLVEELAPSATVVERRIAGDAEAVAERFLGSPTVRVDGHDVEPSAPTRSDFGVQCRVYRTPAGLRGLPDEEWLRAALDRQPGRS